MSNSNGQIFAPVSERDVQVVLGTAVNTWSGLCTHPNINKWSLKKPVRHTNMFASGYPVIENWYSGKYGDYGIVWGESTLNTIDVSNIQYLPPSGSENEPYRILDFDGYYHDAANPVEFISPSVLYNNTGGSFFVFAINQDERCVRLIDLFPDGIGEDWYVAVRVVGGGYTRYRTADSPFNGSQNGNKDSIDISISSDANLSVFKNIESIKVIPFLSTIPLANWGTFGVVGRYKSLGYAEKTISVIQAPYTPKITATGTANMFTVSTIIISITVTNVSNSPVEFQWQTIQFDKNDSNGTSLKNLTTTWSRSGNTLSSETVPVGESRTATASISGSTKVVDSYSAVLDFRWYDGEYGYVQLLSLYAQYHRS